MLKIDELYGATAALGNTGHLDGSAPVASDKEPDKPAETGAIMTGKTKKGQGGRGRAAKRSSSKDTTPEPPAIEPDDPVEIPKPGKTILIVEDHSDMLESIQTLLELSIPNVRILVASDAEEGLRILASDSVQLIVSDYQMPGMDGVEFLRKARDLAPNVARVLLTAHPRTAVLASDVSEAGIHELLVKPMSSEALVKSVQEIFRRKSRDELVPADRRRLAERAENAVR